MKWWRDFNRCWEALGQKQKELAEKQKDLAEKQKDLAEKQKDLAEKQKDLAEEALRTDILSAAAITTLIDSLVGACDRLEQYGLVDYETGIWEEQIIHIFLCCLDLLPPEP